LPDLKPKVRRYHTHTSSPHHRIHRNFSLHSLATEAGQEERQSRESSKKKTTALIKEAHLQGVIRRPPPRTPSDTLCRRLLDAAPPHRSRRPPLLSTPSKASISLLPPLASTAGRSKRNKKKKAADQRGPERTGNKSPFIYPSVTKTARRKKRNPQIIKSRCSSELIREAHARSVLLPWPPPWRKTGGARRRP
jgi:hypothetical protein